MKECGNCKHYEPKADIKNGAILDYGICDKRNEEVEKQDVCDEYFEKANSGGYSGAN